MSAVQNAAPIIIKRKKVIQGGGHHGGAWKVAYADFVTAMMAFFMLMWLLNATTESQRKGLADYFSPTIPISRVSGGGDGMFGGDNVTSQDTIAQNGSGASSVKPTSEDQARGQSGVTESDEPEDEALAQLEAILQGKGGDSEVAEMAMTHVVTRLTDQGLIIELFDLDDEALFVGDTADPSQTLVELARMLVDVMALVKNGVAVEGHVRAFPVVMIANPGWDLSVARAQTMRGLLTGAGLSLQRMERVTGWSDRKPIASNPMAVRNNRLEIILLRDDV